MNQLRRHGAVVAREYASIKRKIGRQICERQKRGSDGLATDFMSFAPDLGRGWRGTVDRVLRHKQREDIVVAEAVFSVSFRDRSDWLVWLCQSRLFSYRRGQH